MPPSGEIDPEFGVWINASERSRVIRPMPGPVTTFGGDGRWLNDKAPSTGVSITENTAFGVSAFWSCVSLIAEDAARLQIDIYRSDPNGDYRQKENSHPIFPLLNEMPNPWSIPMAVWSAMYARALIHGNSYAEIEREGDPVYGRPIAIWPLVWWGVTPWVSHDDDSLYYRVNGYGGQHDIPACNILHFRGFGTDGFLGMSMLRFMRETIGLSVSMEKTGGRFFSNGARPGGILKFPGVLSDEAFERMRRRWNSVHQGSDNSNNTAILEKGWEWQASQMPNDDSQFLESRQFSIEEFARFFRVPLSKLRVKGATAFSNQEQDSIEYVSSAICPPVTRSAQEINLKLLPPGYRCRHNVEELMTVDTATRDKSLFTGRQGGWYSIDDARGKLNLGTVPGGNQYETQLNMVPVAPTASESDFLGVKPLALPAPNQANPKPDQPQPTTTKPASADVSSVADSGLNVAQITALIDIVAQVSQGMLPKSSAVAIAQASFPLLGDPQIEAIFSDVVAGSQSSQQTPSPAT